MLDGFEKITLSPGLASITVSSTGIGFSKTAVERMQKCQYVTVLIDYSGKRFAIQKCENEEGAAIFYKGQKTISVRWNNKELTKTLCNIMNWDVSNYLFKINGDYIPEEEAMIFDLSAAEIIEKNAEGADVY